MHNVVKLQVEEPWNASLPGGTQGYETALMFRVWSAGQALFIWATTRHVRSRLGLIVARSNHDPVLARIRHYLEGPGGYHSWPRGKRLEPVLATIFYGIESCDHTHPWRSWAMDTLRRIVDVLKLKSVEEFKKVLEYFPSSDEYKFAADELWRELYFGGQGAGTPTLTFSPIQ
jgi:hypothetical protein